MKVLIVDNDWRFVQQISAHLESLGNLVIHHPAAETAASHAARWQADLVILSADKATDSLLPCLLSMKCRPAILLTEHMDRYDRAWRAWQSGGDELLMKPVFSSTDLQAAIVTALQNAAAGSRKVCARASA